MSLAGTLPPVRPRGLLRALDRWTLYAMNPPRLLTHPHARRSPGA